MEALCNTCRSPKAPYVCGLCEGQVCKRCLEMLKPDTFAFLPEKPPELSHKLYCGLCYSRVVGPALATYEADLEKARGVIVFMKSRTEETRLMRRSEKPVKVVDCADKEETLLRLAFQGAHAGFGVLIDVELTSRKVRDHAYQTTLWSGTAVPTNVDQKTLDRIDKHNI
jgi:hypothetical protein